MHIIFSCINLNVTNKQFGIYWHDSLFVNVKLIQTVVHFLIT
jgi:hypothetical protein